MNPRTSVNKMLDVSELRLDRGDGKCVPIEPGIISHEFMGRLTAAAGNDLKFSIKYNPD